MNYLLPKLAYQFTEYYHACKSLDAIALYKNTLYNLGIMEREKYYLVTVKPETATIRFRNTRIVDNDPAADNIARSCVQYLDVGVANERRLIQEADDLASLPFSSPQRRELNAFDILFDNTSPNDSNKPTFKITNGVVWMQLFSQSIHFRVAHNATAFGTLSGDNTFVISHILVRRGGSDDGSRSTPLGPLMKIGS